MSEVELLSASATFVVGGSEASTAGGIFYFLRRLGIIEVASTATATGTRIKPTRFTYKIVIFVGLRVTILGLMTSKQPAGEELQVQSICRQVRGVVNARRVGR